jgi:hypothetical protein
MGTREFLVALLLPRCICPSPAPCSARLDRDVFYPLSVSVSGSNSDISDISAAYLYLWLASFSLTTFAGFEILTPLHEAKLLSSKTNWHDCCAMLQNAVQLASRSFARMLSELAWLVKTLRTQSLAARLL